MPGATSGTTSEPQHKCTGCGAEYCPCKGPVRPIMADSKMEMRELGIPYIEKIVGQVFAFEPYWEEGAERARQRQDAEGTTSSAPQIPDHSPWYNWYTRVATGASAVRTTVADGRLPFARTIAWNPKKPWESGNLFFRSLDTCRLLPMDCAWFRVQIYATTCAWHWLEEKGEKNEIANKKTDRMNYETWLEMTLMMMMHDILVARCFHDYGGGDIPMIMVYWDEAQMDAVCQYWVELSKGKWSEEEKLEKYKILGFYMQHSNAIPPLDDVDRVFRALIHDAKVEYIPPFTILFSVTKNYKARFIFTRPENVPPESLLRDIPRGCNSPACTEKDCGAVDWDKSVSLAEGSRLVRARVFPKRVKCNLWPCHKEESRTKNGVMRTTTAFLKCSKCRDVLYCSAPCQKRDWHHHKRVCQQPAIAF